MKRHYLSTIILLSLLLAACASSPKQPPVALLAAGGTDTADHARLNSRILQAAARKTFEGELPLGPGDLLEVSVFDVPEFSELKVRVSSAGTVMLPLLGSVRAADLTPGEFRETLGRQLGEEYLQDPQVTVSVLELKSHRVSVIGAVERAGVFEMTSRLRVTDALAMAEGLREDAATTVYLIRQAPARNHASAPPGPSTSKAGFSGDGEFGETAKDSPRDLIIEIDLDKLVDGGQDLNLPLRSGDVIRVPRAGSVYVGGAVQKPQSLEIRGALSVEQAIVAAGGPTEVADRGDVRIYRRTADGRREIIQVDLKAIEEGRPGPLLKRDDVVMVRTHGGKAVLIGFPGLHPGSIRDGCPRLRLLAGG